MILFLLGDEVMNSVDIKNIIDKYIDASNSSNTETILSLVHKNVIFLNIVNGKVELMAKGIFEFKKILEQTNTIYQFHYKKILDYKIRKDSAEIIFKHKSCFTVSIPNGPNAWEIEEVQGKSIFFFKEEKISSIENY